MGLIRITLEYIIVMLLGVAFGYALEYYFGYSFVRVITPLLATLIRT